MAAAAEVPALGLPDLRRLVSDPIELEKGVRVFDLGGLDHLARHAGRLYAEAGGIGPAPYRVSVAFDDRGSARARCTCMAARSRPFCKHAAGLLVAWAQAPASFAVAEGPPPGDPDGRRRRSVKTGKTDAARLMGAGVEQVETLVRELAATGLASLTGARVDEIRTLAGSLRESRLRRLSGRTLSLADRLEPAARREPVDAATCADLLTDLVLTARKLARHLGGEALEPRYVEELIGKTWRRSDREPVARLDLVEYGYSVRTTADDFVIRESRLFDLASGSHWSEKQILPAFLARRTEPKRSHADLVLRGAAGSAYPGFAPRRIDLESCSREPLTPAAVEVLVERALPSAGAALAAFQEHRRDVFAPDRFPVALRVDAIVVAGARARAVDAGDRALFLPGVGGDPGEGVAAALRDGRLVALLGDIDLEAALPTLWPLAAVVEGALGLELRPIGVAAPERRPGEATSWAAAARLAGASTAAVSLAEVRGELAECLVEGLAAVTARTTEPLVSRLRELGLERPAALLAELPTRAEPGARLDDFVRLYQILGLALVRLCGTVHVDRAELTAVPSFESVSVARPGEVIPPREIARRVAAGSLGRWDAAVRSAAWYRALPAEELTGSIDRVWTDGSAAPHIAAALAGRPVEAVAAAERALSRRIGRTAWMTALRVLGAAGGEPAEALLDKASRGEDRSLAGLAADLLESLRVGRGAMPRETAVARRSRELDATARHVQALRSAPRREYREEAAEGLARAGARHAIPLLRQAASGDAEPAVRSAAILALAELGDSDLVDRLIGALGRRGEEGGDRPARIAARALGILGDSRGLDELLAAYAGGWKPGVVAEALRGFGVAALGPMLDRFESRPELGRRKAAVEIIQAMPAAELAEAMAARLRARRDAADLAEQARLFLRLLAGEPLAPARRAVAGALQSLVAAEPADKRGAALRKLAQGALG